MARRIAIYNKKGGVGKTVISVNLAATIAAQKDEAGNPKYRVLLVDVDPQENASDYLGVGSGNREDHEADRHFGTFIKGAALNEVVMPFYLREYFPANTKGEDLHEVVHFGGVDKENKFIEKKRKMRLTEIPNFKIIPAYSNIGEDPAPEEGTYRKLERVLREAGMPDFFGSKFQDEDIFRTSLSPTLLLQKINAIDGQFDYILFDCPPSWDRFSKMAVLASNQLIVPLKPGEFERMGVKRVMLQTSDLHDQFKRSPDLIFGVMNLMRNNRRHLGYHHLNYEQLKSLVAMIEVPYTDEVLASQSEQVPFAYAADRYPVMANEVFQKLFEEVEGRFQVIDKEKSKGLKGEIYG